jgi:hypothetical protein
MALTDFPNFSIKLWNAKWTGTYTELAANASIDIYDNWAFLVLRDCIDWARGCTCRIFAVHASPVEETPFHLICFVVMFKFEFDMSKRVEGKFWRVCPFRTECCCFTRKIVPSLASYLAGPTTNAFRWID